MTRHATLRNRMRPLALLWLLLAGALAARAQSGPYGNEWIVPGQTYYKLKVWREGLYRLDYTYLSQLAGVSGAAPAQLQLWRRGREVAVYQGGNATQLDNSTYLEFYGQRNDALLDREMYKNPQDQANPHFAFYSDTAAYFLTWGSRAGKRMAQPAASGGAPHPWRLQTVLSQRTETYAQPPQGSDEVHLPWLQKGESYFSSFHYVGDNGRVRPPLDSALRAVATAAGVPVPRLDVTVVAGYQTPTGHIVGFSVVEPTGGAVRELDRVSYGVMDQVRRRYALKSSDIDAKGQVTLDFKALGSPVRIFDLYRISWWTVTAPQQNVWFANRHLLRFENDSLLAGPATYEVDNLPATVVGYDVQDAWNVQRIAPTAAQTLGSTALRFVFPGATPQQTRELMLADAAVPQVPPPARLVTFRNYDAANANYFIISHPQLAGAAGSVPNAVKAYAGYRASATGGSYDTLVAMAPRLYDQFHYGERSVMALRNFARWAAATSKAQDKYLLLLGRAIEPGLPATNAVDYDDVSGNFGNATGASTRVQGEKGLDLVPTTSQSPSDTFLSDDWPNTDFVPALSTGRVPALTPTEVLTYLSKLKEYEAQLGTSPPADWQKNILHLVGGESADDVYNFGRLQDKYKAQEEAPLLGATVATLRRDAPYDVPVLAPQLVPYVNTGLLKLSYFGHGSPTTLDLNPPDITNPASGYQNKGKYPVFEINGCAAANCFFIGNTILTGWLFTPDLGSVGMAAQTGASYVDWLDANQTLVNQLSFNDPEWFGRPIASIRREAIRRLQHTPLFQYDAASSNIGTEDLMCTMWHADPALRFFAPGKPDFVVSNATLSIRPIAPDVEVNANSSQFTLAIGVSNPSRITRDSVEIKVTRLVNGVSEDYFYTFRQAYRRDTTYTVTLSNLTKKFNATNIFGDNTFTVVVNYRQRVAELNYNNNTAVLTYPFLSPGFTLLSPTDFAIVRGNTPRLVALNNDRNAAVRGYDVQVDSVASFDSGGLQSFSNVQSGSLLNVVPAALRAAGGRDSVVWYWRVRFNKVINAHESPNWQTASFRIISTTTVGGWSQSHNGQFNRDQLQGVAVATPGNQWTFTDQTLPVALSTIGGGPKGSGPTFNGGYGIQTSLTSPPDILDCALNAPDLLLTVLDGHTLQRLPVAGDSITCGSGAQTFYHFATSDDTLHSLNNSAWVRAKLLAFLQKVPDGSYVLLVSKNRVQYTEAALAPVVQALARQLGSKLVTTLKDGEPWALVAQKYAAGGRLVAEQGADHSQPTPAVSQPIALSATVTAPGTGGTVLSTRIGPARQWYTLFDVFERPLAATASYKLELLGIDGSNNSKVLNPSVQVKQLDLSTIKPSDYPYLQLRLTLKDSINRVPPQLREWLVTYSGVPEGVAQRDPNRTLAYDTTGLKSQATSVGTISFPVKFDNVSQESFLSPLKYRVELFSVATGLPVLTQDFNAPRLPAPGDSAATIIARLNVIGKFGRFYPRVTVNPPPPVGQPEQYYFNNVVQLPAFTVKDTNIPPVLDVAVDGRHILSGEIVSPTPVIDILLKDSDQLRPITQASNFSVYLQGPGGGNPVAVDVTGPLVHFTTDNSSSGSVARLQFQPGLSKPLADGVYTLHVQGRNSSNLSSGTQDFEVKFEVINASTITNVFPYPNPVTSKARFVFTVTGQEPPRNMKIQILTLTGRVVREIFMAELGPVHIGNNLTDFAWDGTDQYGDRLANGTYLYRVILDDAGGQFSRRATAGDQAFKNDWGKLVLLR